MLMHLEEVIGWNRYYWCISSTTASYFQILDENLKIICRNCSIWISFMHNIYHHHHHRDPDFCSAPSPGNLGSGLAGTPMEAHFELAVAPCARTPTAPALHALPGPAAPPPWLNSSHMWTTPRLWLCTPRWPLHRQGAASWRWTCSLRPMRWV
jgi:hypothetical protein